MGRLAVVTGAASGMGLAIARHLAARGNRVGLHDLQGDAARQAAGDLRASGATAVAVAADVSDRGAVDAALDAVRAQLGPIEIMVAAAGLDPEGTWTQHCPELGTAPVSYENSKHWGFKEYALEGCGPLEATQMGLESRVLSTFPLNDQEIMCRHLNKVVHDWVEDDRRSRAEG